MGETGYRQSNPGSGNHVCKGTEAGESVICVRVHRRPACLVES